MLTRTSTQLLDDLHDPGKADAWALFARRYRPIVVGFARRHGLQDADAEDIAQETMQQFLKAYRAGHYDRDRGHRLRNWLRGIAANRIKEFARRKARSHEHQTPDGDSRTDFLARIPHEAASDDWDDEWRDHILSLCLSVARSEFDNNTSRAFELYAIRQRNADEVAVELGISRNAVYIAKSRVLSRLHALFADFDDPGVPPCRTTV